MKSIIIPYLFLLWSVAAALAHTTSEETFTCPIDREKFKQVVDASGTQFGVRLDSKPLGPTAAPWAIPQCPKCKFVLYESNFDKPTVGKLKPFILSERYRAAAKGNSSYFCLALIREFLHKDSLAIGEAYLQASWQVEADPKKCQEYLKLAYDNMAAGLKALKSTDEGFTDAALLCGEFERRLGMLDDAGKRFSELKTMEPFKEPHLQKILERQLHLIAQKDTGPHAIDESREKLVGSGKSDE